MIGDLNIEVSFCVFNMGLSPNNTPNKAFDSCYVEFVKIQNLSGSRALDEQQITYTEAFRVTKRYFSQRPVDKIKTLINYNGKLLTIHSVRAVNEGRRAYEEMLCYAYSN